MFKLKRLKTKTLLVLTYDNNTENTSFSKNDDEIETYTCI